MFALAFVQAIRSGKKKSKEAPEDPWLVQQLYKQSLHSVQARKVGLVLRAQHKRFAW